MDQIIITAIVIYINMIGGTGNAIFQPKTLHISFVFANQSKNDLQTNDTTHDILTW